MSRADTAPAPQAVQAPRKTGRPTRYTAAAGAVICEQIANGKSNRAACAAAGVNIETLRRWRQNNPAFIAAYNEAAAERLEYLEGRLLELAEMAHEVAQDETSGNARVQAVRLEMEAVKWQLSKLLPKRYGDKQALEVTGQDGAPLGGMNNLMREDAEYMRQHRALYEQTLADLESNRASADDILARWNSGGVPFAAKLAAIHYQIDHDGKGNPPRQGDAW